MTLIIQLALLAILIPAAWILGTRTYDAVKRRIQKRRRNGF